MRLSNIITSLLLAIALISCTKQDRENTIINQEASIDKYISSLQNVTVVRNGGSNRVIIEQGNEGSEAALGDSILIRYAGYIFSTSGKGKLFATNDSTTAAKNDFPQQISPFGLQLGETDLVKGLTLGLEGVKEGEYCYIIFSSKYGFYNTVVDNIPKLSPLFYEVWVDKVIK